MLNKKLCLTIGDPVFHSKGPTIKTMSCQLLGISDEYSFIPYQTDLNIDGEIAKLKQFIIDNNVAGMSVTMPNKQAVIQMCDEIDESTKFMNAVNTVAVKNGKLFGYNTDWIGVVGALKGVTNLDGKKIAILGSGGTTSATLYGLTKDTKNITVFNRTIEKAKNLAEKFGVNYDLIDNINVENFDIIINTTSVGFDNENESPIDTSKISAKNIVFDVIYKPMETKLLRDAKQNGAEIIYVINVLLYGTFPQVKFYTGHELSQEQMKKISDFFAK
ncbi:unnamed protein product [Rotaria magnacalcarata]|nr:unnamed protein product [Rotaria magnacalcarata]